MDTGFFQEAVLTSTHNLRFRGKRKKKENDVHVYPFILNPNFTINKWGVRGSTLHRHVSILRLSIQISLMRGALTARSVSGYKT